MTYLDTGCKPVCYTPLHELEFINALALKVFFKSATAAQVTAARGAVEADLKAGVLVSTNREWQDIFQQAVKLGETHTGSIGCRSLDVLHCAAAKLLAINEFISTDARQKRLAAIIGLNVVAI